MSIVKLLLVVVVVLLIFSIPIISGIIASKKGRSGVGWFFLTVIFPFAILFVLIAAPVSRPSQARPLPPSQSTEPNAGGQAYVSEPSLASTPTVTATSNDQPSRSDQAKTLDWEKLLKYDPDITKAVEKLQAYGEPAVEEFKRAFEAVGGDHSAINHITDVIISDFDRKIHDS